MNNPVKLVTDPLTGRIIAVPARMVLTSNTNPNQGRSTQPHVTQTALMREQDLMSRLPAADLVGARGPGVVPGGEQGVGAKRGQIEQEGQPPPPSTYRPLGGAKQNYRGGTAVIPLVTDGLGSPITTVTPTIVQTPRNGGDDAEGIIVNLGQLVTGPDDAGGFALDIACVLKWGIGGAFFEAELDWIQGTTLLIPASFLSVGAIVTATHQPSPGVSNEGKVILAAGLAYGSPNSGRNASPSRKTIIVGSTMAAGATSAIQQIPAWANSVTVVSGDLAPNFTITLQSQSNTNIVRTVYQVIGSGNDMNQTEHQFPIPNGARFFTITNNSGFIARSVKAIFNLAF